MGAVYKNDDVNGDEACAAYVFKWDGKIWSEMKQSPVSKMNFGAIYTTIGPNIQ